MHRMEWIDGVTLKTYITTPQSANVRPDHAKGSKLKERRRLAWQLLNAVDDIHGVQVVHRDLKPSNIMITRNGHQLKIIDFGLADSDSYCWLKQAAGTAGYSSPEQLATGGADDRNDIYSLGVLLRYLRIGTCYRSVISRCLGPIGNRYGQVDALRSWPWLILHNLAEPRWPRAVLALFSCVRHRKSYVFLHRPIPPGVARANAEGTALFNKLNITFYKSLLNSFFYQKGLINLQYQPKSPIKWKNVYPMPSAMLRM
ncbi:MAG: serine/threonine-protein kinase [Prevotella sp.]